MKKPSLLPRLAAFTLLGSSLVATTGCGIVKSREDRVVVANPDGAAAGGKNQNGGDAEDEELRQIRQFLDLYTDRGQITRPGLANFFEKYKTQIGPFLSGLHMTSQELIDLIFQFDANHDTLVTPLEISDGLMKRIPILRWIPNNTAAITRAELDSNIAREYPQAGAVARAGLGETLMRFDEIWSEGNGDGRLTRLEASGAGIVLGILAQTDFSKGFTIPPGVIAPVDSNTPGKPNIDITPLIGKILQQKIDQQLYTRYAVHSSKDLSADDLRLEWMQLALKFFLSDKLVHHFSPTDGAHAGTLAAASQASALSAWGIPQQSHWATLRGYYDGAIMGGDGDTYFNSIETFNYLTDLEFAGKVRTQLHGQFSANAVTANPARQPLLETFVQLFPRTGLALFVDDLDARQVKIWGVRRDYWDNFNQFDDASVGGDRNGSLDDGEVAMGLLHAKLIENLYELFDTDHDTYLIRSEGNQLFYALGITDRRVIDAFYADVGLNASGPSFWQKLKLFFQGDRGWHWLRPYDFHIRLVQVLPRLSNTDD